MNAALLLRINRVQKMAMIVAFIAIGASSFGAFANLRQFFFSYLFAWLFWAGLSLGCLLVTMIHQLTGGRWGYPTRRFFEAGLMSLPIMALMFVPICFGLRELYPWARPAEVTMEKVLQARQAYLNQGAYIGRQLFFFLVCIWLASRLRKWSLAQDATTDAAPTRKSRALSGPGIVVFGLLMTFASVDWVMSLEKHWYSSLFAVIIMAGQILTAFAFSVIALWLFRNAQPFVQTVNRTHYHHLGNLMLTFVLFWTYVSFGQLLIIYSGDLPHELEWYRHRIAGGWKSVISVIALLHFFVPFLLLLFRGIKTHAAVLTMLAASLLVMHLVSDYWLVMPALHPEQMSVSWLDFTMPIGLGGIWITAFLSRLKKAALLPQNDPGMQFAFVYAH